MLLQYPDGSVFPGIKGGPRAQVQYARTNGCSLGFPLLIRDVVGGDAAGVARPDAADVSEREEARNTHHTHTGAVQVHLSQRHVFQEL